MSTFLNVQERITRKLLAAHATSFEKAVTVEEAQFDLQEQRWLIYVAGGLFATVKKTKDKKYYVGNLEDPKDVPYKYYSAF
jgi:hypothetical protein